MSMPRINRILCLSLALLMSGCVINNAPADAWPKKERTQAHINLGMNYLQRGRLDIARESFEKALEIHSRSSGAYHGLGLVEAKALNLSLARDYLQRSVQLDSSNLRAKSDFAVILCDTGSVTRGIELLEATQLQVGTISLGARLALGRCYEANHELQKAEQAYKEVLAENPLVRQALFSLGRLKYKSKSYLSARAFMQRYFATNTVSSEALLLAANIEQKLNNLEARNQYAKQLWSRYPKSKQATQAREAFSR